ncbi:MAG: prepilin peptidase [Acidiferrobacteraceae bacterium]|nr:prepilin peptidase [Acidiferrobacteraceae bacterium]MBT3638891.1 prepilin peptidase [Acidiferrobacteraceae bacterium]MBT3770279.1 prepilin peptidase [Acidiferrobacteraceae bacterium]MBT3972738.1 prepilin peptidase [Acidiferrobacteraceae bacterium]MBT4396544.1 prepilin peptidase [Acidiferrobacteraceae bacterium]
MLEQDFILSIVTVVFSLLIGSFLNVVIVRLPRQIHWQWEKDEQGAAPPPGIAWPPSHCPSCEHALSWWENLPLLSYLLLRGRCRACGTGISLRYPLVEALTALLSLVVVVTMGPQWLTIAALMLTWALIALAFIDLEHFLLPDRITLPLLAAGLLVNAIGGFTDPLSAVIGAVSGYGLLWAVYHAYRALTGREGFGYGDFKLLGALGAFLGWQLLPLIILLSAGVGAIIGIALILLRRHQRSEPLPFGPFLAGAGWLALLWGQKWNTIYLNIAGL